MKIPLIEMSFFQLPREGSPRLLNLIIHDQMFSTRLFLSQIELSHPQSLKKIPNEGKLLSQTFQEIYVWIGKCFSIYTHTFPFDLKCAPYMLTFQFIGLWDFFSLTLFYFQIRIIRISIHELYSRLKTSNGKGKKLTNAYN